MPIEIPMSINIFRNVEIRYLSVYFQWFNDLSLFYISTHTSILRRIIRMPSEIVQKKEPVLALRGLTMLASVKTSNVKTDWEPMERSDFEAPLFLKQLSCSIVGTHISAQLLSAFFTLRTNAWVGVVYRWPLKKLPHLSSHPDKRAKFLQKVLLML